jgi:hypothetical protein
MSNNGSTMTMLTFSKANRPQTQTMTHMGSYFQPSYKAPGFKQFSEGKFQPNSFDRAEL